MQNNTNGTANIAIWNLIFGSICNTLSRSRAFVWRPVFGTFAGHPHGRFWKPPWGDFGSPGSDFTLPKSYVGIPRTFLAQPPFPRARQSSEAVEDIVRCRSHTSYTHDATNTLYQKNTIPKQKTNHSKSERFIFRLSLTIASPKLHFFIGSAEFPKG
jgi:hypothetical protein